MNLSQRSMIDRYTFAMDPSKPDQSTPAPNLAPPRLDRLPGWKVLLHNDQSNEFGHVIRTVARVCLLGAQEAFDRTREAHEYGLSLLTVTHREHAELLQEQLAEFGLEVTIEPES